MSIKKNKPGPRQRIVETACDLFYRQGYRATGINQVIRESGVAKASFYDHFPSKVDLLYEYLREMSRRDITEVREDINLLKTAEERFYAPIKGLVSWFESTSFRGCPFQNAIAEIAPEEGPVQRVIRQHREHEKALFAELASEYLCDELGYRDLNIDEIAETYLLIFEGAIATASSVRDLWPVYKAEETMKQIVSMVPAQ